MTEKIGSTYCDEDGVLIIDKPAGPTSHDVVTRVKDIIGAKKVGHLGTLDPEASGVLPLAINGATKRASLLAGVDKVYEFTLRLGAVTDTDDDAGKVLEKTAIPKGARGLLEEAIPQFVGDIMQRPPKYSAVKVNGKRAYDLARKGVEFELDERRVRIDSIEVIEECKGGMKLRVACNSGTYVRSLCRDIGKVLGCGGHASQIRRLKSGPYIMDKAVGLDELSAAGEKWKTHLMSL